ncbi:MAG: YoaK family protein [Streptosporangiaceae bacterium]
MQARGEEQLIRRRHLLVVLLTFVSGATDATGFLALGGAFTSVMTGNIVLLGLSAARADGELAGHVAAAIVCYVGGCALGARLAGRSRANDQLWPPSVSRALRVELGALAVYACGWWVTGGHLSAAAQLALLAVNAMALGIQSSAVQRFGVAGLSTTYLTGTLTTLVVRLTSERDLRAIADSGKQLLALLGGAAMASLLVTHFRALVPVVPLACLVTVLVSSTRLGAESASALDAQPVPANR